MSESCTRRVASTPAGCRRGRFQIARLPKTLGVVDDMAFTLDFPVNGYNEGFGNTTNDLVNSIADSLGLGSSGIVTGCGPTPEA